MKQKFPIKILPRMSNVPGSGKWGPVLRLWERFRDCFIRSGLSPQELALTLALGAVIGILPVVWGTTLLCAAAACIFRLNQVPIQAVNCIVYPLQLALFVPFCRIGEKIIPGSPDICCDGHDSLLHFLLIRGGAANIRAIVAWLIIAPLLAIIIYVSSFLHFSRKLRSRSSTTGEFMKS